MDLTEVEGLRDLIDGETELQRRLARGGMTGQKRVRYELLRERIVRAMAEADALIDFGEDDAIGDEAFRSGACPSLLIRPICILKIAEGRGRTDC